MAPHPYLAPEILATIFGNLERADLRHARGVNKLWYHQIGYRPLFRRVQKRFAPRSLQELEEMSQHPACSRAVEELSLFLPGVLLDEQEAPKQPVIKRVLASVKAFSSLYTVELINCHDGDGEEFLPEEICDPSIDGASIASYILQSLPDLKAVTVEHLEYPDNEWSLQDSFGETPPRWPNLRHLSLKGFWTSGAANLLSFLDGYRNTLRSLDLQDYNLQDSSGASPDVDVRVPWEALSVALRRDYKLDSFTLKNPSAWDGAGIDSGIWPTDLAKGELEERICAFVLDQGANPFPNLPDNPPSPTSSEEDYY